MKERGLILCGDMVRAVLDDKKTMTRRIMKPQPVRDYGGWRWDEKKHLCHSWPEGIPIMDESFFEACPYGVPGDRLYCREAWAHDAESVEQCRAAYEDMLPGGMKYGPYYRASECYPESLTWHPSIHMPKWAARIWLEITDVKVERVQDITEKDAKAEGITIFKVPTSFPEWGFHKGDSLESYREKFRLLWDRLNVKRGYGFDKSPWVWKISFKRLEAKQCSQ